MSFVYRPPPVTPGLVVRSTLFFIGQVFITVVIAPFVMLAFALPYRARYRIVYQWTIFITWWLRMTCGLTHEITGKENIPAVPAIVLCKHQSAWETINLQHYFSPQVWVLKRELLRLPIFGWALAMLRPIAIDRGAGRDAMSQVLEQGAVRLQSGCWVVIFPEGTRVPAGMKRRYKIGGATLAMKTGVPVVPVAHDAGLYWPRNSFIKYPGVVRLVIGPPIKPRGKSASEINREAESWIEGTVDRLLASKKKQFSSVSTRRERAPNEAGKTS
ncbi:MAG: 1-acyl-sn-glycerol-3-phosphate acyltransferase [Gammaproteobacteria bacterium]|nr:1-acyl-sn-glycerol-3-phosphate acyltransferase [Gammaproteobacteria bacterium]MDH3412734.1 1-acyl-sn-glycerol-3-phosphate acyltransferase [Gammaproteobacteria bacterium]